MKLTETSYSKGLVEFIELAPEAGRFLREARSPEDWDQVIQKYQIKRFQKGNLVFNFPREQYSKLDRGETPETVNARYFTLSTAPYTNPAVQTVTGESLRLANSTIAIDPSNAKNTIVRFILDVGQFVGGWSTAILIGGASATITPGSGKIVAAVNNVKDDTSAPLNRDGSTIHLVNWKIKHLDSSEVS